MTSSNRTLSFTASRKTIIRFALIAAAVSSLCGLSSTASFAFSAEAQQMCTGDAFRLCSSEIPNISRITACMIRERANLSTGCRAVMDKDDGAARGKIASK